MFTPEELIAIVERIKTDIHSDADLQVLQQMSGNTVAAETRSLAITGDANGATIATGKAILFSTSPFKLMECKLTIAVTKVQRHSEQ